MVVLSASQVLVRAAMVVKRAEGEGELGCVDLSDGLKIESDS